MFQENLFKINITIVNIWEELVQLLSTCLIFNIWGDLYPLMKIFLQGFKFSFSVLFGNKQSKDYKRLL